MSSGKPTPSPSPIIWPELYQPHRRPPLVETALNLMAVELAQPMLSRDGGSESSTNVTSTHCVSGRIAAREYMYGLLKYLLRGDVSFKFK